jgi:hypothetical protein
VDGIYNLHNTESGESKCPNRMVLCKVVIRKAFCGMDVGQQYAWIYTTYPVDNEHYTHVRQPHISSTL